MATPRMTNPLALAVLVLLYERPMHPYEMSTTLRERRKEDSIKLNYGSLYSVVASLQKPGLIEARETLREGNRPERTIYAISEPGKARIDRLAERADQRAEEGVHQLRGGAVADGCARAAGGAPAAGVAAERAGDAATRP